MFKLDCFYSHFRFVDFYLVECGFIPGEFFISMIFIFNGFLMNLLKLFFHKIKFDIKGHIRSYLCLEIKFFLIFVVVENLILLKLYIYAKTTQTQILHNLKLDLKGHERLHKVTFMLKIFFL